MAYTKHEWECGETITAEKLNNLEGGVEEALECCDSNDNILIVTETLQESDAKSSGAKAIETNVYILNKTWQEIYDALTVGKRVVVIERDDNYPWCNQYIISFAAYTDPSIVIAMFYRGGSISFREWRAEATSDYPTCTE